MREPAAKSANVLLPEEYARAGTPESGLTTMEFFPFDRVGGPFRPSVLTVFQVRTLHHAHFSLRVTMIAVFEMHF